MFSIGVSEIVREELICSFCGCFIAEERVSSPSVKPTVNKDGYPFFKFVSGVVFKVMTIIRGGHG